MREPIIKFDKIGILTISSLSLFGISLLLTYYLRTFGSVLFNILTLLTSVSYLITAYSRAKEREKEKKKKI
jgi:hypothetical protein